MSRVGLVAAIAFGIVACGDDSVAKWANASDAGSHGPVGACDTSSFTNGTCVEYLTSDDGYAQAYCTGGMNGEWIASCPAADRVASCRWPSSIQYWYATYSLPLGEVEYQCGLYGKAWTTY